MSPRPICFVDRDGTLIVEPEDYQVDSLAKVALVEGVIPALLRIQEALGREGRRLVLDNVPPPVRKVFELTDLLATFDVL